MSLALSISPHGRLLALDAVSESALPAGFLCERVRRAFSEPQAHGLLQLGARELTSPLPAEFAWARDFACRYHHESGRGVSPEVELPCNERAVLARIGAKLTAIAIHSGRTFRIPKLPACHTQIRFHFDEPDRALKSLMGTHYILSYGEWTSELALRARF